MALIVLQNIKKSYAGETVLDQVRLMLNPGERVGLVGCNGCGKTTLLHLAAGILSPDAGERTLSGHPSIGLLKQEADFNAAETVLQAASTAQVRINALEDELKRISLEMEAAKSDSDHLDRLIKQHARIEEQYRLEGGYSARSRVDAVLRGVGFKVEDFTKPPQRLSGGEGKRLQLATVLLGGYDILFLDEPGNHLDIAGTEWLTDFLKDYPGTILLVSHDRYLLNGVVHRIVELDEGRTHEYKGDCDYFLAEREKRVQAALKQKEAQDRVISKGEEFIRRNFYGQKSRLAKSKRKMLDRLDSVRTRGTPMKARFRFKEISTHIDHVLRLEKVGTSIQDRILFDEIEMDISMGEILGVIGPNGSGKTTLLKNIMGSEPFTRGSVWTAPLAKPAYLDQQLKSLDDSETLLDMLRETAPQCTDHELRNHLARFLFRGKEVEKKIHALSGGERNRALLARLAFQETNLLILDEPTNHLDIYTRASLEEALGEFSGTVIIVSHDRHLLDGIVNKLLVLGDKKPLLHHGNYSSYVESQKSKAAATASPKKRKSGPKPSTQNTGPTANRVKRKHTFEELESKIMAIEKRLQVLEKELYSEEVYMSRELSRERQEEAAELKKELGHLYEEWDTWT